MCLSPCYRLGYEHSTRHIGSLSQNDRDWRRLVFCLGLRHQDRRNDASRYAGIAFAVAEAGAGGDGREFASRTRSWANEGSVDGTVCRDIPAIYCVGCASFVLCLVVTLAMVSGHALQGCALRIAGRMPNGYSEPLQVIFWIEAYFHSSLVYPVPSLPWRRNVISHHLAELDITVLLGRSKATWNLFCRGLFCILS